MEIDTLSPFTPPPEQPDKTPIRHKRKRPATDTPNTSTSAQKAKSSKPSVRSSLPSSSSCPPSPTATSLLSLPPRCPTPSCPHHGGFRALCTEWLYGTQYVLTCPGCQAIIYPCDCCHQVAAHPAASTSYSACCECGFLTLISPKLRRLLRLPPLLPLSSSTTLSIQSSNSLPLYQQHKIAAYKSAFSAYRRAEQASRRQRDEAKDGGESDTTDQVIRPAQPTTSNSNKKRKQADTVPPKAGESTLLRLREELLAIEQLSSVRMLAVPSFQYGVQPLDSVPFTSHHLHSLHTTLLSLHSSSSSSTFGLLPSSMLSSFHTAAVDFFSARAELMSYIQKVRQGWNVLQRVQRTYAELEVEESHESSNKHSSPDTLPRPTDMHTDDEADEQDEHKADKHSVHSTVSTGAAGSSHSKAVQRGVMGIVENVLSCRLQHTCDQLHTRAAPHLPLLSAINSLLLPLYTDLHATLHGTGDRAASGRVSVWCVERCDVEVENVDDVCEGGVELLLWCCWLLRCCYCSVSSGLQRAVYWSDIVDVQQTKQHIAVEVDVHTRAADTEVVAAEGGGPVRQPTAVENGVDRFVVF